MKLPRPDTTPRRVVHQVMCSRAALLLPPLPAWLSDAGAPGASQQTAASHDMMRGRLAVSRSTPCSVSGGEVRWEPKHQHSNPPAPCRRLLCLSPCFFTTTGLLCVLLFQRQSARHPKAWMPAAFSTAETPPAPILSGRRRLRRGRPGPAPFPSRMSARRQGWNRLSHPQCIPPIAAERQLPQNCVKRACTGSEISENGTGKGNIVCSVS